MKKQLLFLSLLLLPVLFSCTTPRSGVASVPEPEKVHVFTVPANSLSRIADQDGGAAVTLGFPFLSPKPAQRFTGRFPPSAYAELEKRQVRAKALGEVDFWRLKEEPTLYQVIYLKGMLFSELKLRGDDLLESIGYSLNIGPEKMAILEGWIRQGGVLWMEPVIYLSTYDYTFNRFSDAKLDQLTRTLSRMTLLGHGLTVRTLRARRIDELHLEPLTRELSFQPGRMPGEIEAVNGKVRSLLLEQSDYVGIYLNVAGTPIIRDADGVWAGFAEVGKGKVLTLAPFDFQSSYHDGELFRLLLLSWAMEKSK